MYKIMRLPDVVKSTGLARSTIYKKIAVNEFPEPVSLGAKSVGWLESDIQQWIEGRIILSLNHSNFTNPNQGDYNAIQ